MRTPKNFSLKLRPTNDLADLLASNLETAPGEH